MTRKSRWTIAAGAALAVVAIPALVAAAQHRLGGHHGPRHGCLGGGPGGFAYEMLVERLDLSAEQRDQMRGSLDERIGSGLAARRELGDARSELFERIHAETFDEAAIRTAAARLGELEVEQALERARLLQQIHELLTPEQRAELEQLKERWHEYRGERPFGPRRRFREPTE